MSSAHDSPPGRVAGIDFGTVRFGVALSDPSRTLASPHAMHQSCGPQGNIAYFVRLAREEQVALFVIGLPVHLSGRESEKSRAVRQFAVQLEQESGIPVALFDERFTSVEAEQHLMGAGLTKKRRVARRDMLAAQIMLSAFLESQARGVKASDTSEPLPLDDAP